MSSKSSHPANRIWQSLVHECLRQHGSLHPVLASPDLPPPIQEEGESPFGFAWNIPPLTLACSSDLYELLSPQTRTASSHPFFACLTEQQKELRQSLGLELPSPKVVCEQTLEPNSFLIRVFDTPMVRGSLPPNKVLCTKTLQAEEVAEELLEDAEYLLLYDGTWAFWMEESHAETLGAAGYRIWPRLACLGLYLSSAFLQNLPLMLRSEWVHQQIQKLRMQSPQVVSDLYPHRLPLALNTQILQHLAMEFISIRDLAAIFEALLEWDAVAYREVPAVEFVRRRLVPPMILTFLHKYEMGNTLQVFAFEPHLEELLADFAHRHNHSLSGLSRDFADALVSALYDRFYEAFRPHPPVFLVRASLRRAVFELFAKAMPYVRVLEFECIPSDISLEYLGWIPQPYVSLESSHALEYDVSEEDSFSASGEMPIPSEPSPLVNESDFLPDDLEPDIPASETPAGAFHWSFSRGARFQKSWSTDLSNDSSKDETADTSLLERAKHRAKRVRNTLSSLRRLLKS